MISAKKQTIMDGHCIGQMYSKLIFVYNPDNHLLHNLLLNERSEFEAEQQKMLLKESISYNSNHQIELFSPKYKEQYISIHSNGGYWTADKVIDASDRFRFFLAIELNKPKDMMLNYNI